MSEDKEEIREATQSELFEYNLDGFLEELSVLNETLSIQLFSLDFKHKQ